MRLSVGLIALAAVFSMTIPAYVYGQSQIAALPPAVGPTTASTSPSTMLTAQCIDFNSDGVCEYVLLANGTMISNPLLYMQQGQSVNPLVQQQAYQPVNPMTQLVERQKILIKEAQRDNDEDDDNSHRDDPDCWYGNLYVCDENGKCDSDKFDCITDCADGSTVTTGEDCPDRDDDSDEPAREDIDTGGSDPNGEEEDQNCGGEACTDDEKEDSWTDEEEDEPEESESEEIVIENLNNEEGAN